jgi:hypothetical protein
MRYERFLYIIQDIFIPNLEAARYVMFVQKGRSGGRGRRLDGGAASPGSKSGGKMNILYKKFDFLPKRIFKLLNQI